MRFANNTRDDDQPDSAGTMYTFEQMGIDLQEKLGEAGVVRQHRVDPRNHRRLQFKVCLHTPVREIRVQEDGTPDTPPAPHEAIHIVASSDEVVGFSGVVTRNAEICIPKSPQAGERECQIFMANHMKFYGQTQLCLDGARQQALAELDRFITCLKQPIWTIV